MHRILYAIKRSNKAVKNRRSDKRVIIKKMIDEKKCGSVLSVPNIMVFGHNNLGLLCCVSKYMYMRRKEQR